MYIYSGLADSDFKFAAWPTSWPATWRWPT